MRHAAPRAGGIAARGDGGSRALRDRFDDERVQPCGARTSTGSCAANASDPRALARYLGPTLPISSKDSDHPTSIWSNPRNGSQTVASGPTKPSQPSPMALYAVSCERNRRYDGDKYRGYGCRNHCEQQHHPRPATPHRNEALCTPDLDHTCKIDPGPSSSVSSKDSAVGIESCNLFKLAGAFQPKKKERHAALLDRIPIQPHKERPECQRQCELVVVPGPGKGRRK